MPGLLKHRFCIAPGRWEQGCIALHVYENNDVAINAYKRNGYRESARDDAWRAWLSGRRRILMAKSL